MAEIISLFATGDEPGEVWTNKPAIEALEDTLARLKSGHIVAVAVVEVQPDGYVTNYYCSGDKYNALNSGCARLQQRIASEPADDVSLPNSIA